MVMMLSPALAPPPVAYPRVPQDGVWRELFPVGTVAVVVCVDVSVSQTAVPRVSRLGVMVLRLMSALVMVLSRICALVMSVVAVAVVVVAMARVSAHVVRRVGRFMVVLSFDDGVGLLRIYLALHD